MTTTTYATGWFLCALGAVAATALSDVPIASACLLALGLGVMWTVAVQVLREDHIPGVNVPRPEDQRADRERAKAAAQKRARADESWSMPAPMVRGDVPRSTAGIPMPPVKQPRARCPECGR